MKTPEVLSVLRVFAWIFFIGMCIETGALVTSFLVRMFSGSDAAMTLYPGTDLSQLYGISKWHYIAMVSLIVFLSGLKAYLFFLVVKIISRVNIAQPFSENNSGLISKMSGIALQIGVTSLITDGYAKWLMKNKTHFTYEGGDTEFLFLAGILFVIAQIFKRGVELQAENELTI